MSTSSSIGSRLSSLEHHVGSFAIEALCGQLEAKWIIEVLAKSGRASQRVRDLPAELVVWMIIAMGLFRSLSIANVWVRLREGFRGDLQKGSAKRPTSSAMTQARDRLGLKPLILLFRLVADLLRDQFASQNLWCGLKQVALDGSSAKVPDSTANRRKFGGPKSHRGKSGYPFLRFVTLVAAQTHAVLAAAVGGWHKGEVTLATSLLSSIEPRSLVLLDRGFLGYWLLWCIVHDRQSHFLIRGKRGLKVTKRKNLGKGDWLAEASIPRALRKLHPELPQTWTVRKIHYQIPGYRASHVLTSLLDPVTYPAKDLVTRYHVRWEQELAYDEIKTHLVRVPVVFRSETPKRVLQEFFGLLIAYNLVRGLMAQAAERAGISPLEISFVDSVERIRCASQAFAYAPARELLYLYRELLDDIGTCRLRARRARRYPRAVKVKMSSFPLKHTKSKRPQRAIRA